MPASENNEVGQGGAKGEIHSRASEGANPNSNKVTGSYSRNMQIYAYTSVTCIIVAMLIFVGYLYKKDKVSSTDTILMFILGQLLGVWIAITNKIFRIYGNNQTK